MFPAPAGLARHEVGVAEDDLVDLEAVEGKDNAAPQDEITQRRLAIVELFEERRRRHSVSYPRIDRFATGMCTDEGTGLEPRSMRKKGMNHEWND